MKPIIIFRASAGECDNNLRAGRPHWFNKKTCWTSVHNAFTDFDIHVVWDGDENELSDYIFRTNNISFHKVRHKSNQKSLLSCYDLINDLNNPYFFLVEDDHLFLPQAGKVLQEAFQNRLFSDHHFISLYDRPHGYRNPYDDLTCGNDYLFYFNQIRWRTIESCQLTFGFSREVFNQTKDILIKYCLDGIGAPIDREMFRYFYKQGRRIFACLPGMETHCMDVDLSWDTDWEKLNNKIMY